MYVLTQIKQIQGYGEEEMSFLSKWHRGVWLEFVIAHQNQYSCPTIYLRQLNVGLI